MNRVHRSWLLKDSCFRLECAGVVRRRSPVADIDEPTWRLDRKPTHRTLPQTSEGLGGFGTGLDSQPCKRVIARLIEGVGCSIGGMVLHGPPTTLSQLTANGGNTKRIEFGGSSTDGVAGSARIVGCCGVPAADAGMAEGCVLQPGGDSTRPCDGLRGGPPRTDWCRIGGERAGSAARAGWPHGRVPGCAQPGPQGSRFLPDDPGTPDLRESA